MHRGLQVNARSYVAHRMPIGFTLIGFMGLLMVAHVGIAATINFGPNGCTLQDAIRSANNDNAVGNCAAGSGFDHLISPDFWEITVNSRLPTITSDLVITTATGSGLLRLSGDNDHAVMKITGNDTDVTLQRVRISNAVASSIRGPALHIEGADVTLNNTIFAFNRTSARYGGAIYIDGGELDIVASFLEFNTAVNNNSPYAYGGAVYAEDADVVIRDSSFTYNSTASDLINLDGDLIYTRNGYGASIAVSGGTLDISGSTFNEDITGVHGEATVATITNSTFNRKTPLGYQDDRGHVFFTDASALTLNHVTIKAALRVDDSILNMTNSILRGACNISSSTAWIIDAGNLYNTQGFACPGTGNLFDYPRLLNLDNYGGPTETIKLQYNSDAINAGHPTYCAPTDQRGVARGVVCDMGAYEAADLTDLSVTASIDQNPPFVHTQQITTEVVVNNNSDGVINEFRLHVDTVNATITDIDFTPCPAFPCVIVGLQPHQTITIPIQLSLSSFQPNFSVDAQITETTQSTHTDTNPDNDAVTLNGTIENGADLAVSMDLLNPGNHFVGQFIDYQVAVENLGHNTATGVNLAWEFQGLDLITLSGCQSQFGTQCDLGSMPNGAQRQVTLTTQITATDFDASVTVQSDLIDLYPENNVDDQGNQGAVNDSDIAIEVTPDVNGPHYSYGYMRFRIKLATGNLPASNIKVWEFYPGAEFIGCSAFWNLEGYCEVPFIPANDSVIITIDYFNPITTGPNTELIDYWVFAAPGETDTNPSDNEFIFEMPITPQADMVAQLDLTTPPPHFSNQEILFDLRVVNAGVNHATGVQIDTLTDNLELIWTSGVACAELPCVIPQLDRFNEENMVLAYRIIDGGPFALSVGTESDQDDMDLNNNIDTESDSATPSATDVIFADDFEGPAN